LFFEAFAAHLEHVQKFHPVAEAVVFLLTFSKIGLDHQFAGEARARARARTRYGQKFFCQNLLKPK